MNDITDSRAVGEKKMWNILILKTSVLHLGVGGLHMHTTSLTYQATYVIGTFLTLVYNSTVCRNRKRMPNSYQCALANARSWEIFSWSNLRITFHTPWTKYAEIILLMWNFEWCFKGSDCDDVLWPNAIKCMELWECKRLFSRGSNRW